MQKVWPREVCGDTQISNSFLQHSISTFSFCISRLLIPFGIPSELYRIPVGVGPLDFLCSIKYAAQNGSMDSLYVFIWKGSLVVFHFNTLMFGLENLVNLLIITKFAKSFLPAFCGIQYNYLHNYDKMYVI